MKTSATAKHRNAQQSEHNRRRFGIACQNTGQNVEKHCVLRGIEVVDVGILGVGRVFLQNGHYLRAVMLHAACADVGKVVRRLMIVVDVVQSGKVDALFADIQHGSEVGEVGHYRVHRSCHGIGHGKVGFGVQIHYFYVVFACFKHVRRACNATSLNVYYKIHVVLDNLVCE